LQNHNALRVGSCHPRIHVLGLLTTRGNNGQAVFLGPADSAAFLTALQAARER
jgi:hypothetical protein